MKKLNLIRRQVIELRQRRPLRAFMGCLERIHEHGNPQWENRGCTLFQYETTQNELHEILSWL
jgi:hypothetical protein